MIESLDNVDFNRLAEDWGISGNILRQDYAATACLDLIGSSDLANKLIFMGGTAIKRIYYPDSRFSIDLDFVYMEPIKANESGDVREKMAKEILYPQFKDIFEYNFSGSVYFQSVDEPAVALRWSTFPVNYEMPGLEFYVRIDVLFTNDIPFDYNLLPIKTEPYGGIGTMINTLSLQTIVADKIDALYDRTSAKDLWDLYFVFTRGVKLHDRLHNLVNNKLDQILRAIDFISEYDWKLLRGYIPKNLKFEDIDVVRKKVREFITRNW